MTPFKTDRLCFREMTDEDLDAMASLLGDPDVMTYYPEPKSRAESQRWIDWNKRNYIEHGFGLWIVETHDGVFVGDCGLTWQPVNGVQTLEVGYHVRPEHQRRGYASEAADACLSFARALGTTHIVAIIHPENVASQRVAQKIGLVREGVTASSNGQVQTVYGRDL